jgi:centrosomal protein CEP104
MFPTMVKLQVLQVLMHQYKIPKIIEVFAYSPHNSQGVEASQLLSDPNNEVYFKKVGHFTLDDNSASGFKARELKTVYIDVACQYLKLSLQKCYSNEKNIFNQAAIVSLKCIGTPIGTYESHALHGKEGTMATQIVNDEPY